MNSPPTCPVQASFLDSFARHYPELNYCSLFFHTPNVTPAASTNVLAFSVLVPWPAVVVMTSSGLLNRYPALTPTPTCLKRSYQTATSGLATQLLFTCTSIR